MDDVSVLPQTNELRKLRERKERKGRRRQRDKGEKHKSMPPCHCPGLGPDFPSARDGMMTGNGSGSSLPIQREWERGSPSRMKG